ncbi:MAG TPA: glycosyltransferase family 2 protein [Rhizomicrobium sp.]|nr:glycosyltransferase family 2 protein [Rhizomicrobium sp.]
MIRETFDGHGNRAHSPIAPLISVVVAFYNEEETVPAFFRELDRACAGIGCAVEYICVNDGSRDRTLRLLRERMGATPGMRVIDLARNFGKEAAITAGLAEARGNAAVVIDADLQDPPSLIPAMVAKWRAGFDVVYGVRTSRASDSALKRLTAGMFYAVFNRMTDVRLPPGAGDFRLMDRRAVDALLRLPERNRFMKGLFAWVGFRQTGVEFVRDPRIGGNTKWNYFKLANFALDGITSFSIAPLRLASLAGFAASLFGFAYAAWLVVRTTVLGVDVPGYASLMVMIMVLGGVQLLCLGLIGEYLGRLYVEAKGRPLYVVADIFENQPARPAPGNGVEHAAQTGQTVRKEAATDGVAPCASTEMQPQDRRF